MVRRRVREGPVRQPEVGGEEGAEGPPAVESDRFIALRSHYLFASQFTTPGLEGAHEKGGVEGEVGRYRRNHLVPVPELRDLAELNAMLLAGCERILADGSTVGGDGRPVVGGGAAVAAGAAGRAVRRVRNRRAARRREVVGHDPSEPLLGPGPAGGVEGERQDRRAGR